MNSDPGAECTDRLAVEARLKRSLDEARARYERANAEFHRLNKLSRNLGRNTVDGAFALHQAAQRFRGSVADYRQELTRFCDFILRGKLPDA